MTKLRPFALTSACLLTLALAACGEREHKTADVAEPVAPMSETVSDVTAASDVAATVPASETSVRVPASGVVPVEPTVQADLNDDEVAAAGDTRRRPAPSDTPE